MFVEGLPASVCGGFIRQCLWRVYPPVFVEGSPAYVYGGFTRLGWDMVELGNSPDCQITSFHPFTTICTNQPDESDIFLITGFPYHVQYL